MELELQGNNALSQDFTILNKYRQASDISAFVLKQVALKCQVGARVADLCAFGDQLILEQTSKVFRKAVGMEKGIAFPTCVNINSIVSGYAASAQDATELKEWDVVHIELGAHIDGYIATTAHTLVVLGNADPLREPIEGRVADAVCAAYYASELIHRLLRPGTTSAIILAVVQQVAEAFHCQLVDTPIVTEMRRFLDGIPEKTIHASTKQSELSPFTVGVDEVYAVNVVMTTGDSDAVREVPDKSATIFRRNVNQVYSLKLKSARQTMSDLTARHSVFPFHQRALIDAKQRLGFQECLQNQLFHGYPVFEGKRGDTIVQFKSTVVLQSSATTPEPLRITNSGLPLPFVHSSFELPVELQELMKVSAKVVKPVQLEVQTLESNMDVDRVGQ